MGEAQEIVTTGVDALISLLRTRKLVSVEEAAKLIHVRESIMQNWVDFLIEEGIIGVEYKFITPYIFLKTEDAKASVLFDTKDEFFEKARARKIPDDKAKQLWKRYLTDHIASIKLEFYRKLEERKIPVSKQESLWAKYEQILQGDSA